MSVSKFNDGTRFRRILLAATLALGPAAAAQSSTFTWEFSGTIGQPTNATAPATFSGAGTDTLLWGAPESGNFLNALSIVPSAGSVALAKGENTSVQVGAIQWTNASVFDGGGIWNTVLSLIASFGNLGVTNVSDTVTAAINVNNTPDGAGVPLSTTYATGLNPDIITGLSLDLGVFGALPTDLGGGMSLLGFSADIVTVGQCGTSGLTPGSSLSGFEWDNCEGNTSVIGLSANVRYDEPVAPVPLPAAGWLLLGSLAGLGALRARRANRTT